ncbi:HAD domain-containing protein [Actinoplanes sp. NPDC051346]|uniref:HAD domain-containing protein n=1 Tax=Actinoplanes sp. NPDC051346 TaxID=3155048 RepID=UPI003417D9CC
MTADADHPLVFLDVDGPLIPFRARPVSCRRPSCDAVGLSNDASGNPLVDRLDPADGHRLLELGCQLVWATTWMAEANEVISPQLGLPELPVVDFPDADDEPERGLHWKTRFLTRWAAGRSFVWIDDEVTDADRRWVRGNHPGKALVHRVDPFVGLTDADVSSIRRWLADCQPK